MPRWSLKWTNNQTNRQTFIFIYFTNIVLNVIKLLKLLLCSRRSYRYFYRIVRNELCTRYHKTYHRNTFAIPMQFIILYPNSYSSGLIVFRVLIKVRFKRYRSCMYIIYEIWIYNVLLTRVFMNILWILPWNNKHMNNVWVIKINITRFNFFNRIKLCLDRGY